MVDDGNLKLVLCPSDGIRIGAFTGQEQGTKLTDPLAADVSAFRILALDGADGGWGCEEQVYFVLADDAPESARIWRSNRFTLVQNGRAAGEERCINDVGMTDRPTDVGGGPEHVAILGAIDVEEAPCQGDCIATGIMHHAFRNACR